MNRITLLDKFTHLAEVARWPAQPRIDVARWLSNFSDEERPVAEKLGVSFTFIEERQFVHQLADAILQLRRLHPRVQHLPHCATWRSLVDTAVFCCFDDGKRHLADSGSYIARQLRESLGIPERRIRTFRELARDIYYTGATFPVVFVDDILASGDQFIGAWTSPVAVRDKEVISLAALWHVTNAAWFFLPVFATRWGLEAVNAVAPQLIVSASEIVGNRESWTTNTFTGGNAAAADAVRDLIERAHGRSGARNNGDFTPLGYKKQGLTLAFHHGIPDCSIPIFFQDSDAWRPLFRKAL